MAKKRPGTKLTAKKQPGKRIGPELVRRMKEFTEQLATVDGLDELSSVVTVRVPKRNLTPPTFTGTEVQAIRKALKVSQPIFAEFLGVSTAAVRDWEQDINQASGLLCRILVEMQRNPKHWFAQFRQPA